MPTPRLSDEACQQVVDALELHGSMTDAAKAVGLPRNTFLQRHRTATARHFYPRVSRPLPTREGRGYRVLAIPDLHAPFQHPDALAFLTAIKEQYAPQRVVCLGDEVDAHAISQHDPDPDGYSAGHELNVALEFMQELYKLFPICSVVESNHGVRPFKRAYRAGLPRAYLKDYAEFMDAPKGWAWHDSVEIDGVKYIHGEGYLGQNAALNAAMKNMKPVVIGHVHSFAGIQYFNNGERQIFGLNAGCLVDGKSYAMKYAKHHPSKPILGAGLVDKGVPMFIPMVLNESGRWVGKV